MGLSFRRKLMQHSFVMAACLQTCQQLQGVAFGIRNGLDMPIGQSPTIERVNTLRGQRKHHDFVKQKLLNRAFTIGVGLQRGVFLELLTVIGSNTSLHLAFSRVNMSRTPDLCLSHDRSQPTTIPGQCRMRYRQCWA